MKTMLGAGTLLLLLALPGGAQDGGGAPWMLTFSHEPLDVVTVPYLDGTARSFYLITFTIENRSAKEAKLALQFKADVGSNPKKRKTHYAFPTPDAEEFVRRISRSPDLKNVQQINKLGTLKAGGTVRGIAVFGTFHREWDVAIVTVAGLEPRAIHCRVRKYGESGFTLAHRAYGHHNKGVLKVAGKDAEATEVPVILKHTVIRKMQYHREGDEFAPHLDPILKDSEGWDVIDAKIVMEKKVPFGS